MKLEIYTKLRKAVITEIKCCSVLSSLIKNIHLWPRHLAGDDSWDKLSVNHEIASLFSTLTSVGFMLLCIHFYLFPKIVLFK